MPRPEPPGQQPRGSSPSPLHVLVLTDSLAFHGPGFGELTTEARLWPNVLAASLTDSGTPATATIYGRRGWTARDVWFAITGDPYLYSVLMPAADVVILAVGGMDYLPAVLPTHLREGIRLLRPKPLRRLATATFRRAQPHGARALRGRWRTLPQSLTDHYLSRSVIGIRQFHPDTLVLGIVPPPHAAPGYGRVVTGHRPAVAAARAWSRRHEVAMLPLDEWVAGHLADPDMNPDGLHWGWQCHREVGERAAASVTALLSRAGDE